MFQPTEYLKIPFTDLLTWTFGNAEYDHDKPLFVDAHNPSKAISYNQAKTYVRKLIAGLQASGLRDGDSVCLHSFNNINYPLVYLAVIGAGGCFVGSNPAYTTSELIHLLDISEAKFVIVEPELLGNVRLAAVQAEIPFSNVLIFNNDGENSAPDFKSWEILLEHGESDWVAFHHEIPAKSTTAALMSTSGTTGLPKAAQSSHFSQVAQSMILCEIDKPYQITRLLCLPQFHAFNAPLALIAPIREGHTTYIMKRYHPEQLVEYIERYNITETTMVNPIIFKLLGLPEEKRDALASLRAIWCGGVPLVVSVQNQLKDILHPDAIVTQVWGMTEVFWITVLKYPEKDNTGSAGRLLPNMEARIIDEDGQDLHGDDVQGEILVRGPSMMMGYLKNQDATKATIVDGWLHTGDIGYQKAGKWYIVDRAKEIIKVRGWQVSPTEIEAFLLTHPAVVDVAVIGVDFLDHRGELPRAYVVLDPALADSVTDKEIQNHLRGQLAKYKALDGGVKRVDHIPRSPAGKILKKLFIEQARDEIAQTRNQSEAVAEEIANSVEINTKESVVTIGEKEIANVVTTFDETHLDVSAHGGTDIACVEQDVISRIEV